MSKFTDEQIKFLESAVTLTTVGGRICIDCVATDIYGSVDGTIHRHVLKNVKGTIFGSVNGSVVFGVGGDVGDDVGGKVYGTIQGWSAWKYFLEFLKRLFK